MNRGFEKFIEYMRLRTDAACGAGGILRMAEFLFIVAKFGSFYYFMDVSANYGAVTIMSSIIVAVMFAAFKRKLIPAVIYALISVMMFADIIYHGYYNSYLSVRLLNSAYMLGDITESVREIIQPEYFVLFADVLAIFLIRAVYPEVRRRIYGGTRKAIAPVPEAGAGGGDPRADEAVCGRGHDKISALKTGICVFAALTLVFNPFADDFLTSAGSQEVFTYHVRDLLGADSDSYASDKYYIATGTYEDSLSGGLFGAAEGRNLIVIQVESLQNFLIGREYNGQVITPFLNSLISDDDTIYFDHYYYQIGAGNTSDAEFATNNSILGTLESYTYDLYDDNYFKGLPWLLRERGYSTAVMHGYDGEFWNRENMYPAMGFEEYFDDSYYDEDEDYSGSGFVSVCDESFYRQSIPALESLKQPFYAFMITLSGHHPFDQGGDNVYLEPEDGDEGTLVYNYLNTARYEDMALESFFNDLKESGLYDDSIICIYGDHYGLSCEKKEVSERLTEILGEDYNLKWHFNVPLIVNIPGSDADMTVSTAGGQLDFMPTIAYLLGFEELDTLYMGQNLITAQEGYAAIQSFMLKGSFITDDVLFQQSRDGVFSNSNVYDIDSWKKLGVQDYEELSLRSKQLSNMSEFYLKNDVLDKVLNEDLSMKEILAGVEKEILPDNIVYIAGDEETDILSAMDDAYAAGERCVSVNVASEQVYEELSGAEDEDGRVYSTLTCEEAADWASEHEDACVIINIETGGEPYISKTRSDLDRDTKVVCMTELYGDLKAVQLADEDAETGYADDEVEGSGSYAIRADTDNIIINASTMKYFAAAQDLGFENVLFEPDLSEYNESDYETFFMSYTPWAVLVPEGTGEAELKVFSSAESPVYERSGENCVKIFELQSGSKGSDGISLIGLLGDGGAPALSLALIAAVSAGAGGLTVMVRRFKRRGYQS